MTTMTLIDCENAEPVSLNSHPLAKIVAAVRERARANRLNFILADRCLQHARAHYGQHGSLPLAIDAGQRKADELAGKHRVHVWRGSGPEAA